MPGAPPADDADDAGGATNEDASQESQSAAQTVREISEAVATETENARHGQENDVLYNCPVPSTSPEFLGFEPPNELPSRKRRIISDSNQQGVPPKRGRFSYRSSQK